MTFHTLRPAHLAAFTLTTVLLLAGCASTEPAGSSAQDAADEQINVGYGTMSESDRTTAVSRVDPEEGPQRKVSSVEEMLNGRVAGVHVQQTRSGSLEIRIRGTSSIYGSNEPLFVVDGVPVRTMAGGGLYMVNPADVESIEVLKDAGAAAIYGSRGANGVILITTKRSGGH